MKHSSQWPSLNYSEWKSTYDTLHRFLQIIGKIRMCRAPWLNHSWSTVLSVSSRGLTTNAIPIGDDNFTIEYDLLDHEVKFSKSNGQSLTFPVEGKSIASFYHKTLETLKALKIPVNFDPAPNELPDALPFESDSAHREYDRTQASAIWDILVRVNNVFEEYRAQYVGKSSPSHFFWGSFDLAVTRFSGKKAPEHPGGIPHLSDDVVREAYSHEVMSIGFWPGNASYPEAAFYAYAYPEPNDFSAQNLHAMGAFYHKELREFLLPYEIVRSSSNPRKTLMHFLESSYTITAELAGWDRDLLESSPYLKKQQLKFLPHSFQ